MGNIINPVKFRLGWSKYWTAIWANTINNLEVSSLHYQDILLYRYISFMFSDFSFLRINFLWYDTRIIRVFAKNYILVYFFSNFIESFFCASHWWFKELYKSKFFVKLNSFSMILCNFFIFNFIIKIMLGNLQRLLMTNIFKIFNLHNVSIKFFGISPEFFDSSLIAYYIRIKLKQRYSFMQIIKPLVRYVYSNLKKLKVIRGIRVQCSGRLSRKERASYLWAIKGKVPLTTVTAKVDFSSLNVFLHNSVCCIKVWISYSSSFKKLRYYFVL